MKREHTPFPAIRQEETDMLTLLRFAAPFSSRKKDTYNRFFSLTLLDERKPLERFLQ